MLETEKEFEAVWEQVQSIRGWYLKHELYLLYLSALQAPDGYDFFELGCYCGRSALVLGFVACGRGVAVRTVDHFQLDGQDSIQEIARRNFYGFNLDHVIAIYEGDYRNVDLIRRLSDRKYGLLHIDGGHDESDVEFCVSRFVPLLDSRGIVCFHDYSDNFCGVKVVVDRLISSGVWEVVNGLDPKSEMCGFISIRRRLR